MIIILLIQAEAIPLLFLCRCPSFRADIPMLVVDSRKINEKFLPLFQTFPDKGSLYLQ